MSAKSTLFRSMKASDDGRPVIAPASWGLGVRVQGRDQASPFDVVLNSDDCVPLNQGASVAVDNPRTLPGPQRPHELGGTSKKTLFELDEGSLPGTLVVADKKTGGHAVLGARVPCKLEEYEAALHSTRPNWSVTNLSNWTARR